MKPFLRFQSFGVSIAQKWMKWNKLKQKPIDSGIIWEKNENFLDFQVFNFALGKFSFPSNFDRSCNLRFKNEIKS